MTDDIDKSKNSTINQGIWFNGNKPSGDDTESVCILFDAANKGCVANALIIGPACCLIDILDTSHRFAVPIPDDCTKLQSSEEGTIRILSAVEETGEKFCAVLLGSPAATSSTPRQTAIVMEAIHRTEDVTADPSEYTFGKIRVSGKEYPEGPIDPETGEPTPPVFDDCCCLALGKDPSGDNHQQLYKGQRIEISGPFKRKNPEYDPEDERATVPEFLEYYEAEPIKEYWSKLDSDVQWDAESGSSGYGTTTITMKDSDGQDVVMFVSGEVITQGFKVSGNAESYRIILGESEDGNRLIIVGGRCQQKVE